MDDRSSNRAASSARQGSHPSLAGAAAGASGTDIYPEQSIPMMPLARSVSQQHTNKMDDPVKQKQPTGVLAWIGFGCALFSLATLCISFASPYWIEAYPQSFNEFRNIGLWEVCFDHYMHYRDQAQEIFTGCYWVFDGVIFNKLKEWLLPPWFIACQVMATGCLLINIAAVILVALVFLHLCPIMNHEYHQTYAMFIAASLMFLSTMTILVTAMVFGFLCQDWTWMPRPDFNIISWGYGFFVISGIVSSAAGFCLYWEAQKVYAELMDREDTYAKQALDMEVEAFVAEQAAYAPSGYEPSVSASYGQPSFAQTSFDKYGNNAGQTSYDSYGQQQGYGGPQQGYDSSQDYSGAQQGYDGAQPQGYGAPQQGYGAPQQGYGGPQQGYGGEQQQYYGGQVKS